MKELLVVVWQSEDIEDLKYNWNNLEMENYNIKITPVHKYDTEKPEFFIAGNQVLIEEKDEEILIDRIKKEIGYKDAWEEVDAQPSQCKVCWYTFDHNKGRYSDTREECKKKIVNRLDRKIKFLERNLKQAKEERQALLDMSTLWSKLEEERGDD